jgi:hypothetical protein
MLAMGSLRQQADTEEQAIEGDSIVLVQDRRSLVRAYRV